MPPRSDEERLLVAISVAEPRLRRRLVELLTEVRDGIVLAELVRLLEQGRTEEALRSLEAAGAAFAAEVRRQYGLAAQSVADHVAGHVGRTVTFDQTNWRAVDRMRAMTLDRIREITDAQRGVIRHVLVDGVSRGINPREMARNMRDSVGLTRHQLEIVENFRRALETGDPRALDRSLRDARYDRSVRGAIEGRKNLTRAQIDNMVERYRQRWIRYRAEMIARTEALRAVHQGAEDLWAQVIASGEVSAADIINRWLTAADERVRGTHRTMHGQERLYGVPFTSGGGVSLLYPCDPSAPLKETAGCRCVKTTRFLR